MENFMMTIHNMWTVLLNLIVPLKFSILLIHKYQMFKLGTFSIFNLRTK